MSRLVIIPNCKQLSLADMDRIFGDFLGAIAYEKETGFVTEMAVKKTARKGVHYVPIRDAEKEEKR